MRADTELESQIAQWRGYVQRHRAIAAADVDEMEDHLREQIADLSRAGLSDDEAFLVAVKRMGNVDAISREFAREHSNRLWKQLVLVSEDAGPTARPNRELLVVLALGLGAGIAVRLGLALLDDTLTFWRNAAFFVFPFLAGYFAWKRRLRWWHWALLVAPAAVLAVAVNAFPFGDDFFDDPDTEVLAGMHVPIVLWLLVGLAYVGGRWRSDSRRMDFIRFTGEFVVYLTLLLIGLAVLLLLTGGAFDAIGVDLEEFVGDWALPIFVPLATLVAAWLVEAKQNVIENIAPVLTRVFTPLTTVMLLALLVAFSTAGSVIGVDRDLLILMDLILVLVLGLLLYAISARDPLAPADRIRLAAAGSRAQRVGGRRADAHGDADAHRRVRLQPEQGRCARDEPGAAGQPGLVGVAGDRLPAAPAAVRRRRAVADPLPPGLRGVGGVRGAGAAAAIRIRLTG